MDYSDAAIASHLKVNKSTAFRWRKLGFPVDDLEKATQWAQNRKPAQKRNTIAVAAPSGNTIEVAVASGHTEPTLTTCGNSTTEPETPYSVRNRLQAQEKCISAEIAGLNAALEEARNTNDEKAAYRLLQALKSAREEHRRQADSLLKAEGRIIILERSRGDLINLSVAKDFISKIINPFTGVP